MMSPTTHSHEKVSALYVHVPFCVHKCGYCDFNSWAEEARQKQELWLRATKLQFENLGASLKDWSFDTVFFGGGTPSLLKNDLLEEVLNALQSNFRLTDSYEWSLECNPETLSKEKLDVLKRGGVNRLSLGLQSFQNKFLDRLERRARRDDNIRALELLAEQWEGRWSADLMFALPHQSLEEMRSDILEALRFGMQHLSAYQLTLTTQKSKNWSQPPEEKQLEMFDEAEQLLKEHGLYRYEVSNYCVPGQECRHNLRYWRMQSFLGVGPGACGVLSGAMAQDLNLEPSVYGYHQKQPSRWETWLQASEAAELPSQLGKLEKRSAQSHFEEMCMMGFRLSEGLPERRFPWPQGQGEVFFEPWLKRGQMEKSVENWVFTPAGLRLLDSVLPEIFEKQEKSAVSDLDLQQFDPIFV